MGDHAERVKVAWTELVTDDDIVIIAGDISWGLKLDEAMADLDWIHELPGQKVLLRGNHDLWWCRIQYLRTLYDDMHFLQNDCYYVEPLDLAICGSRGWPTHDVISYSEHDEKMYLREQGRLRNSLDEAKKKGASRIIVAMHYPQLRWKRRNLPELCRNTVLHSVSMVTYTAWLHGLMASRGRMGV